MGSFKEPSMQSKILVTLLMLAVMSSCNSKKDTNEANPVNSGDGSVDKARSTLVLDLMKMEFSMKAPLNLRDANKENFTEEINGTKLEYIKYTYGIQNNKIVKKSEAGTGAGCSLTAALLADINPDNAVLETKSKMSLNKSAYDSKSQETNGLGSANSKLEMSLGYGHKSTATVLNIVCEQVNTLEDLKNQLGEIIRIEEVLPSDSAK